MSSNPFATRFVRPGAIHYRFSVDHKLPDLSLDRLVDRLQTQRAGLIVGPHGSGKTTLLHSLFPHLRQRLPSVENLRLTAPSDAAWRDRVRHRRRMAAGVFLSQQRLDRGGLLVVDGAEQLSRIDIRRLRYRAARCGQLLLATTHAPRGGVPILFQTSVDADLVRSLTEALVAGASPETMKIVGRELRAVDWTNLSNVRDLWFDLYDAVQPSISPSLRP